MGNRTTIVIESHPVISAAVALACTAFFVGGSAWLAVHGVRQMRGKKPGYEAWKTVVVGVIGVVFWAAFAAWWWRNWSPWAVELTDDAVELRYLLSTRRIAYAELERVEFELVRLRGSRERSVVRLSAGGRVYGVTKDPEPYDDLPLRPARRMFDQLAARVPPDRLHDVTE